MSTIEMMKEELMGWMKEHRRRSFIYFGAGILALFALFYFMKDLKPSSYRDYVSAHVSIANWMNRLSDGENSLEKFEKVVRKFPELHQKFDAAVVQSLIGQHRLQEAQSLQEQVMNRIEQEVPYHALFAKTSFLISKGDLQTALTQALSLKDKILNDAPHEHCAVLNIYNWVRLSSIYRSLNSPKDEYAALKELESLLKTQAQKSPGFIENLPKSSINSRENSLLDYIQFRKGQLSQQG